MNNLIIYAHPNNRSFNNSILEKIIDTGNKLGHESKVRNLYKMNFQPVLSAEDFDSIQAGEVPADIRIEQDWIRWADTITFIYPIWWTSMPAILKGYIDRILLHGFAYAVAGDKIIPLLKGKKVVIYNTLGQTLEEYQNNGMIQSLNMTTDTGIFDFCGMKVLEHKYFGSVNTADENTLDQYLIEVETITSTVAAVDMSMNML